VDPKAAIEGLALMLSDPKERAEAFEIALQIAMASDRIDAQEQKMLAAIRGSLELDLEG
jgi:tellurite resistance protein